MDFSETIEVKVFDQEEHYSVDSYFFAYFPDMPAALDQIRDAVRAYRLLPERSSPQMVLDTTVPRHLLSSTDRAASAPAESTTRTTSGFSLTSLLRPLQETLSRTTAQISSDVDSRPSAQAISDSTPDAEEFTHISRRPNSSFIPVTTSPQSMSPEEGIGIPKSLTPTPAAYDHTYPPSTSTSSVDPDFHSLSREGSSWIVGVPSWLRGTRRVFGSASTGSEQTVTQDSSAVREMYSSTTASSLPSSRSTMGDMVFSILETPETAVDADTTEKFRATFAYDERETLLGCTPVLLFMLISLNPFFFSDFPGYLFRLLPVHGRLYISTNYFCFKSSGPLTARTRVRRSYIPSLKIKD